SSSDHAVIVGTGGRQNQQLWSEVIIYNHYWQHQRADSSTFVQSRTLSASPGAQRSAPRHPTGRSRNGESMTDPLAAPQATAPARAAATSQTVDLLAVGQLFLDVLYGPLPSAPVLGQELFTEQVSLVPGGIANFAAAAAALGARAEIAAPIGDGPLSALTRTLLADRGIGTDALEIQEGWDLQLTTGLSYDGDRALVTAGLPPTARSGAPRGLARARSVAVHLELGDMPWLVDTPGRVFADVGWDPSGAWDRAMLRHLAH